MATAHSRPGPKGAHMHSPLRGILGYDIQAGVLIMGGNSTHVNCSHWRAFGLWITVGVVGESWMIEYLDSDSDFENPSVPKSSGSMENDQAFTSLELRRRGSRGSESSGIQEFRVHFIPESDNSSLLCNHMCYMLRIKSRISTLYNSTCDPKKLINWRSTCRWLSRFPCLPILQVPQLVLCSSHQPIINPV